MKMSKEKCIKMYNLMIEHNGRPSTEILNKYFTNEESMEISRELNIGRFAVFTDHQLVTLAKKAKGKLENN